MIGRTTDSGLEGPAADDYSADHRLKTTDSGLEGSAADDYSADHRLKTTNSGLEGSAGYVFRWKKKIN